MYLTEAEDIKKRWQEYTEEKYKERSSRPRLPRWCDHSPRARHPGMRSQAGLEFSSVQSLSHVQLFATP